MYLIVSNYKDYPYLVENLTDNLKEKWEDEEFKYFKINFDNQTVIYTLDNETFTLNKASEDNVQFLIIPSLEQPYMVAVIDNKLANQKEINIFEIDFGNQIISIVDEDGEAHELPMQW